MTPPQLVRALPERSGGETARGGENGRGGQHAPRPALALVLDGGDGLGVLPVESRGRVGAAGRLVVLDLGGRGPARWADVARLVLLIVFAASGTREEESAVGECGGRAAGDGCASHALRKGWRIREVTPARTGPPSTLCHRHHQPSC